MPYKQKVSVIRHTNCPEDCLLKIGQGIENKRGQNLKAVASLSAKVVRSIESLDVESDTSKGQHRRHGNIIGFNNLDEAKIRQTAQRELARQAQLILKL